MAPGQRICELSDIADPGTREFSITQGEWPVPGFVVRWKGEVRAYVNRCPHAGHLLNWRSSSFLAPDGALLVCTSHGASFDPTTGTCVAGPCVGASLCAIDIDIVDGQVVLNSDLTKVIATYWGR